MLTLIVGPQMLGEESGYEDVVHALQPAGVVAVSIEVTVTVLPDTRTGQAFIGSVEAVVTTPSGGLETVRLQDIGDDVTVPNRPGVYPSSAVPCHCGFDVPLMVRYLPGDPGTAMAEATYQSERAHLPTDILRAAVLEALGGTVLVSAAVLGLWRAMRRQAAPPPGPTAGARARPGRRRRRFWTCVLSAVLALACLELIPLTATSRVRGSAVAGTATLVTLAFLSLLLAWWARRRSRIRRPAAPARRLPLPRFPLTSGRPR